MPFNVERIQKNELRLADTIKSKLIQACQVYITLTRTHEKTLSFHEMMTVLDQDINTMTRTAIMAA